METKEIKELNKNEEKGLFVSRYKLMDTENEKLLNEKMSVPAKLVKRTTKSGQNIYSIKVAIFGKDVTLPGKKDAFVTLEKRLDKIKYDLYVAILDKEPVTNSGSGIEEVSFKGRLRLSYGLNKNGDDCYIYDLFIIGKNTKKCISDYVNSEYIEYMQIKNILPPVEKRIYSDDEEVDVINFDF